MLMYRVERDGKFSSGGYFPSWKSVGKFWRDSRSFHLHLGQYDTSRYAPQFPYVATDEVVVYELVEIRRMPICDFLKEL